MGAEARAELSHVIAGLVAELRKRAVRRRAGQTTTFRTPAA
jgi:hypothetical protein